MITEALRSHLLADAGVSALCDQVFPLMIPQGYDVPAIVYGIDNDTRQTLLEGASSSLKEAFIDLDVYTSRYESTKALGDAIETALAGHTGVLGSLSPEQIVNHIRLERRFDLFENDTKYYRDSMQFYIAYY